MTSMQSTYFRHKSIFRNNFQRDESKIARLYVKAVRGLRKQVDSARRSHSMCARENTQHIRYHHTTHDMALIHTI